MCLLSVLGLIVGVVCLASGEQLKAYHVWTLHSTPNLRYAIGPRPYHHPIHHDLLFLQVVFKPHGSAQLLVWLLVLGLHHVLSACDREEPTLSEKRNQQKV